MMQSMKSIGAFLMQKMIMSIALYLIGFFEIRAVTIGPFPHFGEMHILV